MNSRIQSRSAVAATVLLLLSSLPAFGAGADLEKRMPECEDLRSIRDSLEEFRSDRALLQLVPLLNARLKRGLSTDSDRKALARLLTLAGYAYFVDENLEAGLNMFRQASAIEPGDLFAKCFLANGYRELPDYAREEKLVRELEALPEKIKTVFVYSTLARHYKRLGDFDKAIENLDKAEKLDKEKADASLQIYYARTLLMNGMGKSAAARFKLAAKRTENPYMREIFLANAAMVSLDESAQEAHLRKASQLHPDEAIWKIKMSDYCFGRGKDNEGRDLLQQALLSRRFSGSAYLKMARYLCARRRFDDAHAALSKYAEQARLTTEASVISGEIESARGALDAATRAYKRAVQLDPRHPGAYEGLTAHYIYRLKKPRLAKAVSQAFVKEMPKFWGAHFLHARSLLADNDLTNAEREARAGLELLAGSADDLNVYGAHESARAHAIIGTKYYVDGNVDAALEKAKLFNRMKFNPDLPAYLKIVVLRPGRLQFNDSLGLKDAFAHAALADMLLETKRVDEAIAEYRKALKISDDSQIRSYLMHALSQKGDWGAAARENLVFSQQVVNQIPAKVEEWTKSKGKKNDSPQTKLEVRKPPEKEQKESGSE